MLVRLDGDTSKRVGNSGRVKISDRGQFRDAYAYEPSGPENRCLDLWERVRHLKHLASMVAWLHVHLSAWARSWSGLSVRPRGVARASSESSSAVKMNASLANPMLFPAQANHAIRKVEEDNQALREKLAALEDPAGNILKQLAQLPQFTSS